MRMFKGHRTSSELLAETSARGILVSTEQFKNGSDYIGVNLTGPQGKPVLVLYSVVNGRFFHVARDGGISFSSDEVQYEGEPWFDAMLDLFYVGPLN